MAMWEQIGLGLLALAILFFWMPNVKQAFSQTRKAEKGEWTHLALILGLVVLFVLFLISTL